MIGQAFDNGLDINIWTVDGSNNISNYMNNNKITGIITNHVLLALDIRKSI